MVHEADKEPNLPPRPNPAQINNSMRYVTASCVRQPLSDSRSSNQTSMAANNRTSNETFNYVDILDFVIPPPGSATGQTTNLNSSLNLNSVLPSTQQISSNIQSWMSGTNGTNNGVSNNEYLALSHHQSPVPTLAPTNNNQVAGSIPRPVSLHNHQSSSSNNRAKHHLIDFNNSSSSSNSFNTNSAHSQLIKSPEDIERDEKIELVKSLIVNNNNNNNNNNNQSISSNNNNNSHTNHNNNNLSLRSNRPVSIPPLSSSVSTLNGQINFVANQLYSYQHQPQSNQINLNYVNIKSNNLNSNTLNNNNNNQFSFGATCKPNNSSSVSASITSPILANIPNNNNNNNGFTFYQNIPMSGFVNPNYSNRSEQMIINKINNNNSNFENTSNDIESKLKQIKSPTIDKFQFPSPSTTPVTTTASPFLINSRESGILTPTSIFVPPNDSSKTIIDMFDPLAQPVPDTPPPPYPLVASAIATESSNSKSNESNTSGKQSPDESSKEILADSGSDSDVNSGSSSPKSLNQSEIFECLQIEERPIWQQNQELQHFCDHLKALYITISSKSNLANSGLVFSPQIEIKTKFSESEEFYKATDEVELSENMATFVVRFHPKVFAKLTNKSVDQYNPEKDYIKMCCSINSTVEAIVSHVIFNVDACDEKYSETINSQDFLLKFHGRNEFLVPETSLSSYVFVHQCKAMSLDVSLELVDQTLPELWRPFQRSKSDIDRIQNRFTADQLLPSQLLNRFIPINFNHLSGLIDNLNVDYGTFISFLDVSAGISKQEKNKFFTNILNRIQKICNFLSHIESSQLRDDIQTFKELNERCLLNEQTEDFPNLGQLFNKAYFEIIKSLAKIIELYSKCFPVNFRLKKSADSDNDNKNNNSNSSNNKKASTRLKMSITMLIDTFSVYVDCGVQAPEEWRHQYSSFALRAIIYHGLNVLDYKYLDQFVAVDESNRLEFKQKLSFNMLISNLPRETRVEFLLLGLKGPFPGEKPLSAQTRIEADGIASTFLFMFDYEQRYQQGAHLLPLTVLKPVMTFPSPLSFNNNETIREFKQSLPETCQHFLDYNSDPSASMLLITVNDNDNFDYYFPEIRETQSNTHSNSRTMLDTVIPFPRSLSSISDCSTQDSLYGFYGRNIGQLDKHNRSKIVNILQRNPLEPMSRLERELIWENRQTLSDYPGAILKIMNSPPTWSYHDLKIIYQLLEQFDSYPSPGKSLPNEVSLSLLKLPFNTAIEALQLLDADFTDTNLRQMAVRWLSTVSIDELCDYLPQLVQSLRYESYVYCSLIWLLFESSLNSVRFCHFFYWNLNLCRSDPLFGDRCQIYMNSLLILCGQKVCDMFRKQDSLCSKLAGICAEIKAAKEPSRNKLLASRLEHIHELLSESPISIPLSPSMQVCGLEVSQCSYFPSNSLPLKIVFHGTPQYQSTNENQAPAIKSLPLCEARKTLTQIIFKCGDDLRQDMLVMQIISIINRIWLRDGLDLRLIIFGVMNNADRTGMIEMVGRAKTLRQIQVQHGVTGSFKQNTISDWLKGHNPSQFDYGSAVGNFVHSCAGYVVITYLLGICDRHNDNIMVTTSGHLFHIDFGKFLGDAQMMAGFKRDRVPFVFTADMAYVINSGDKPTKEYHYFVDLCCKCFSLIRQNGHFLLSLFSLMIPSGIFGLTPETIKYFHNALMPQYSDSEARAQFNRLIEKALGSFSTQFNFFLHNIAQMRFSSDASGSGTNYEAIRGSDSGIGIDSPIGDDQTLTEMDQSCCDFSFNKRRFTQALDGKIVRVEIVGIWKRYEEMEKVYYYKIKIERKNFPDNYVYRSYKELVELNEKISDFFKMVKFVRLTRSPLLGRTNTHEVAEQRCTEIRQFLYNLMSMASEISHSDMVYTFFHSVNRDQDYLEEHQSMIETRHNNAQNSLNQMLYSCDARGQIKLGITYRDRKLQILVSHAKNLKSTKNPAGPDTYVKLYLLPDPTKSTKRKTRVVSRSAFPTYMESLVYDNVYPEELKKRSLEASVWEHDSLGSRCLGSAYIGLGQLDLKVKTEDWFPLETNSL